MWSLALIPLRRNFSLFLLIESPSSPSYARWLRRILGSFSGYFGLTRVGDGAGYAVCMFCSQ
jgi:hypothetical protein